MEVAQSVRSPPADSTCKVFVIVRPADELVSHSKALGSLEVGPVFEERAANMLLLIEQVLAAFVVGPAQANAERGCCRVRGA